MPNDYLNNALANIPVRPQESDIFRAAAAHMPQQQNLTNWHLGPQSSTGSTLKDFILHALTTPMPGGPKGMGASGYVMPRYPDFAPEYDPTGSVYKGRSNNIGSNYPSNPSANKTIISNTANDAKDWSNPTNWPDSAKYELALRNQQAKNQPPVSDDAINQFIATQDQLRGNPVSPWSAKDLGPRSTPANNPLWPGKYMPQQMWNRMKGVSNQNTPLDLTGEPPRPASPTQEQYESSIKGQSDLHSHYNNILMKQGYSPVDLLKMSIQDKFKLASPYLPEDPTDGQ